MNIRGMNEGNQDATDGIYNNMMFSPLDFFPTIESRFFGGFRRSSYALAIDDPSGRFFVPTIFFTQHPPNFLIDSLEKPGLQPFLIMIIHRGWRRKIMR